jgi:hypothetical protein
MSDLARAMKNNPKMRVLLTGGYYDLATPFFEGIYEMHHLQTRRTCRPISTTATMSRATWFM